MISLIKLRNINKREECIRFANRTIVKAENHLLAMKQKQKEVNEARALAKKGVPIEEIAKTMSC